MRQDCCGISPTFLCLRSSSGWDCPKRYSKLIQSTVTAQKCFAFHSFYKLYERCIASYHHQSLVEGHLVEDEPWQQSGHCRRTPCWGWARTSAWTEISIVEVDAALCLEPVSEWWNFEEVVSSWDRKGFCLCTENWEVYTFYQTKCLSVQDSGIGDLWYIHIWTALCMDSFFVGQPFKWTTLSWEVLPFRYKP